MSTARKVILGELIAIIVLTVLQVCGVSRPAAPVHVLVGAAARPDVQTTIYSSESCTPCRRYLGDIKPKLIKDGYVIRDATDKEAESAHIIINKDHEAAKAADVEMIPCTIIRKHGKEADRFYGPVFATELDRRINAVAKRP